MKIPADQNSKILKGLNPLQGRVKNSHLAKNLYAGQLESARDNKIREASRGFEEVFIRQMLSVMRESGPKSTLFGKGLGKDFYVQMFDAEIAKSISSKDGVGLSNVIFDYLKRIDDRTKAAPTEEKELYPLEHPQKNFQLERKKLIPFPAKKPVLPESAPIKNQNMKDAESKPVNLGAVGKNSIGRHDSIIKEASKKFGVDSNLIRAVILKESGGRQEAVSSKGAKGLMQLVDGTAREMGVKDVFNPRDNIFGGTRYLRTMLDQHGGDKTIALAAYNAGPGNVRRYGGIPPFKETRNYVRSVMSLYNRLESSRKTLVT